MGQARGAEEWVVVMCAKKTQMAGPVDMRSSVVFQSADQLPLHHLITERKLSEGQHALHG